ncbi:hypothetical protein ACP70R_005027 [Stipagrostis hirtigluma subsp. patula]
MGVAAVRRLRTGVPQILTAAVPEHVSAASIGELELLGATPRPSTTGHSDEGGGPTTPDTGAGESPLQQELPSRLLPGRGESPVLDIDEGGWFGRRACAGLEARQLSAAAGGGSSPGSETEEEEGLAANIAIPE